VPIRAKEAIDVTGQVADGAAEADVRGATPSPAPGAALGAVLAAASMGLGRTDALVVQSDLFADLCVSERREDARAPQYIAREGRQDASEHRCGQRKLAARDEDEQLG